MIKVKLHKIFLVLVFYSRKILLEQHRHGLVLTHLYIKIPQPGEGKLT